MQAAPSWPVMHRPTPCPPIARLIIMSRSKSSAGWLREHFNDEYVKKAQAEGLRSRAAYKLEEVLARDRAMRMHF